METAEEIAKALSLICLGVIFAGGIAAVLWFRKKEREFRDIQPVSQGRYWRGKGDYDKVKDKPQAEKRDDKIPDSTTEVLRTSSTRVQETLDHFFGKNPDRGEQPESVEEPDVDPDIEEAAKLLQYRPEVKPENKLRKVHTVNQYLAWSQAVAEKAAASKQNVTAQDATVDEDTEEEPEDDGSEIESGDREDTSPEEKRLTPEEMKAQADLFLTGFVGYSDAKHDEAVLSMPPCGNFTWAQRRMIIGIDPSAVHLAAKQFGYLEQQWPCRTLVSTDATPEIIPNVDEPCPHEADFFRYALATAYDYLVLSRNRMMPPTQEHDLNVERAIVCAYAMCYKLAETHKDSLDISDTKS